MKHPALALIEFKSVARGILATDAIVKKAPVEILETHPICPGKYMALFCGEVGDVDEALKEGLKVGGDLVVNELFLPVVHKAVIPALRGATDVQEYGAIGIIESFSISSCLEAADIAAKKADVTIIEIRLANGLGGKGYFVLTGDLPDVEASLEAAKGFISDVGLLTACEIIPSPHPDLIAKGVYW